MRRLRSQVAVAPTTRRKYMKNPLRDYRLFLIVAIATVVVLACENPTASGNNNPPDSPPQFSGNLVYRDHVSSTGIDHLRQIYGIVTAEVNGATYVFAPSYSGDAVTSFQLGADGSLTEIAVIEDDDTLQIDGPGYPSVAAVGDAQFLVVPGYNDNGFSVFRINSDGTLTNTVNINNDDDDETLLRKARSTTAIQTGDKTFLLFAGFRGDGLSVFELFENGTVDNTDNFPDASGIYARTVLQIEAFHAHGQVFVVPVDNDGSGISLFTLSADGELTNIKNISATEQPGLLDDTYSVRHATMGDNDYLYTIGTDHTLGGRDIAVLSLGTDGTASYLGSTRTGESNDPPITDGRDAAIIQVQDRSLLVTASYGTNEATVLEIQDDGSLVHLSTIDGEEVPIAGTNNITYAFVADALLVIAGGFDGLIVFELQ